VTIYDDRYARGTAWISLWGNAAIDPRGSTTTIPGDPEPPPPPPSDTGDRFLYTSAQITEYRNRMSGSGPFYSSGQGFAGTQTNAPADGVRAVAECASFLSNPSASTHIWQMPISNSGGSGEPNVASRRPMAAAWCWLTQTSRSDRETIRTQVKSHILSAAQRSDTVFTNTSNYPLNYSGSAPSPIFELSSWVFKLLKMRDLLGRDQFSTSENTLLDKWFYDYANWIFKWFQLESIKNAIPGRLNHDYSVINYSGMSGILAYDSGPDISNFARYNHTNRHGSCLSPASAIANYLKHFGVQPSTANAPSYGFYTVNEMLTHSRAYAEEWVVKNVGAAGWSGDFHRRQSTNPRLGWDYAGNEAVDPIAIATYHARRGDMTVATFETQLGHLGTAGSPNSTAGVTGFTNKSIRYAAWMYARYVPNGWSRTSFGVPLASDNAYRDVINSALASKLYPSDTLLASSWKRIGSGFPGYPSTPGNNNGRWNGYDGEMGKYMGLIELGGV
jgi:hypothetical protein